jgi:anti-sigma B factor antagonist
MPFSQKQVKKHTVIIPEGSLDIYSAPNMKKEIHSLIEDGVDSLVFDLKNIRLIDSSGIALLANLQKKMKSEEGSFHLINVNKDVEVILKLSSLDKFFQILPDEDSLP